ncbi:GNAT family N-acetyltransferase [Altererythrobacter sp. CC-YST694]|uniref:GNAT family N-acetyltransferase n=1 Tax=Altererythrobacter sp. CC-YST694 TaxID=2755038 RepID=UPI001D0073E9|nr:GNAT family N-acetyltransferase [Altererythrobacter sp. CC-YST694]MCB5425680.1 GNAT family N-acetyltransferase [Altererythrobacter sp. CC-YST694]
MNGLAIRRAGAEDLDALAGLFDAYRQFYEQPADLAGAWRFLSERMSRGESTIFLAELDGKAAGFTQLYPSFTSAGMARIFILNDLFVAPEARGQGVATGLLRRAAEFARAEGAVRLVLSTATDNFTAQAVYEREGWKRDDVFLNYRLGLE